MHHQSSPTTFTQTSHPHPPAARFTALTRQQPHLAAPQAIARCAVLAAAALALAVFITTAACSPRSAPIGELTRTVEPTYQRAVVAADHPAASRAGYRMIAQGGNAVDAAVAASFAISVVRPESAGIGGGGFMLIYLPERRGLPEVRTAIDYRERAPAGLAPDTFLTNPDADPRFGGHAVATPGTVAGLLHAHDRYGRLPRRAVLAPAIELAANGYRVDQHTVSTAEALRDDTAPDSTAPIADWVSERRANRDLPHGDVWAAFLRGGDLSPGTRVRNGEQAIALELIAEQGRDGFYQGEVARAIVRAVSDAGGVLALDDLASYQPTETQPLDSVILGRRILAMPPPSTGGVAIIETANILQAYHQQMVNHVGAGPLDARAPDDPVYVHALVESLKHAFADRARVMADPEAADLPIDTLISSVYAVDRAEALHPDRTLAAESYGMTPEQAADTMLLNDDGTSHISVVDPSGGAVSVTETINLAFGSRIVVPGYGFALNNQIDDFATRPGEANAFGLVQSAANAPGPGKRPISSMSPTIMLDGAGEVVAVAGASGGPRIISATLQTLLNAVHFDLPATEAVLRPRVHHQWLPDVLHLEPSLAANENLVAELRRRGHAMNERDEIGAVQLIRRAFNDAGAPIWHAASDPRKGGQPVGE